MHAPDRLPLVPSVDKKPGPLRCALQRASVPYLVLAVLVLVFFAPLTAHPTWTLYSDYSDILALTLPANVFLVESWQRDGELPLWCPCSYSGSPFVHDIQVFKFYPPHAFFYALNASGGGALGSAMSWMIAAHVLIAGWGAYAHARWQGLTTAGALTSGIGFMFAGKWMLHLLGAGHYPFIGLAWLPWISLFLEQAIRVGSVFRSTMAGTFIALMLLGTHTQAAFYGCLFVAAWTFAAVIDAPNRRAAFLRWIGLGIWSAVIGVSLAAIQLLPTAEASTMASRSLGVDSAQVLPSCLQCLMFVVGPALVQTPHILLWEDRGGFTVLWLAAAIAAPLITGGTVRYRAAVCAFLFLFAFGGAALFQPLPGFRLFRQPTRMLLIAGFPTAYLAGVTVQALAGINAIVARARIWQVLVRLLAVVGILVGGFAIRHGIIEGNPLRFHPYWLGLFATIPAVSWWSRSHLAGPPHQGMDQGWAWIFVGLLLVDLGTLTWPLVDARPIETIYAPSECVEFLSDSGRLPGRVLDRDVADDEPGSPLGAGAPLAMIQQLEAVRGYNPVDNLRYREYLQMIAGSDRPLVPMQSMFTFPVILNFPIVNKPMLDLLGVRYLLQPSGREPDHTEQWQRLAEDPHPRAFDYNRGMVDLPAYTVYENRTVLPRAFVVHGCEVLPEGGSMLTALSATDFRRTVLLERPVLQPCLDVAVSSREAVIKRSSPNEVVIDVTDGEPGWLVLADPWFPGWTCHVNGVPQPVLRANYAFRAISLPGGPSEVVFRFAPDSYWLGRLLSLTAFGAVVLISLGAFVRFLQVRA